MNNDAYKTYVGNTYKQLENVVNTVKRLALIQNLKQIDDKLFLIDYDNGEDLPFFNFPVSTIGMNKKPITVIDDRPFLNKQGKIINQSERIAFHTCGFIMRDMMDKDYSIIHSTRTIVGKAFVTALDRRITQRAGLEPSETYLLSAMLTHYYVCLTEKEDTELSFISYNLMNQISTVDSSLMDLFEDMGYCDTLPKLFEFIKKQPKMYKLKSTSLIDFIALGRSLWFSSIGNQVMSVALEFPPLLIGIATTCAFNPYAYGKTGLGTLLDPKVNEKGSKILKSLITNKYPLDVNKY